MSSPWLAEGDIVVRARSGWVYLGFTMIVTVPTFVAAFVPLRPTTPAIAVTTTVLTVIAYIYFVAPTIVVGVEAILVRNSWLEHVVPWGAIADVETRFNLTLVTTDRRVHAQAVPGPGLLSGKRDRPDTQGATARADPRQTPAGRPDDLGSTVSGSLAAVIRGHRQELVESGSLDMSQRPTVAPRMTHLTLSIGGLALSAVLWLLG